MAEIRERAKLECLVVRLATTLWLVHTSKAMKKLESEHGIMDREEWDLSRGANMRLVGFRRQVRVDWLPEASIEEFERAMEKEGHTCHAQRLYDELSSRPMGLH